MTDFDMEHHAGEEKQGPQIVILWDLLKVSFPFTFARFVTDLKSRIFHFLFAQRGLKWRFLFKSKTNERF